MSTRIVGPLQAKALAAIRAESDNVRAILDGRYHVDLADIQAMAEPVLRHRLVLNFHARADGVDSDSLILRLLKTVPKED